MRLLIAPLLMSYSEAYSCSQLQLGYQGRAAEQLSVPRPPDAAWVNLLIPLMVSWTRSLLERTIVKAKVGRSAAPCHDASV